MRHASAVVRVPLCAAVRLRPPQLAGYILRRHRRVFDPAGKGAQCLQRRDCIDLPPAPRTPSVAMKCASRLRGARPLRSAPAPAVRRSRTIASPSVTVAADVFVCGAAAIEVSFGAGGKKDGRRVGGPSSKAPNGLPNRQPPAVWRRRPRSL